MTKQERLQANRSGTSENENLKYWTWAALAARLLLGGLFIFSGFSKAAAPPQEFGAVIEAYYILPPDWIMPLATFMPWMELIFGVFLLAGYWTRMSAIVLGTMLCTFIMALLSTITRGVDLPNCGCFGSAFHIKPSIAAGLDIISFCLIIVSYKHGRRLASLDNWVDAGS